MKDPTDTTKPAVNIPSIADGVAPDGNGNVASGIAPAGVTTPMQSPIAVYPLTGLTPYDPAYSDSIGGFRHLDPVTSDFKLVYRRNAVPMSFNDSQTDMQKKNGNVWVPDLQSGEEAYKGHFLQAVGTVNVHVMVYKNWDETNNAVNGSARYGTSGSNSALENLLFGNYGVMVRFKMEKGVNAAAISKAIVWDRAYFKLAIDVPRMTRYVSRIYVPMQFDHTVYLDAHHPNVFYLKVKGIPVNVEDIPSDIGIGSMVNMRGIAPYGTTHTSKVTGAQPAVPSTVDLAAYRKAVPAAKDLTDAKIKSLIQQDLRDYQNNVKTYTGNSWQSGTFKENNYPVVPAAAQKTWQPGNNGAYDLLKSQYQVNSYLDAGTITSQSLWSPGEDLTTHNYSYGYPFTYSLLDALYSLNSMPNSFPFYWKTLVNGVTNIISQDGFAGSCFVNFFIDMDKYDGNLDDHSPKQTLTKGFLMPSAQVNHQYNLSMDIVGSDQLVDPKPVTAATDDNNNVVTAYDNFGPHNTPMDRALIKSTYYTDAHATDPGYLWKQAATPSNDTYFNSIPAAMRWNQDPKQEANNRMYWADEGKVGGNINFSVAMNSWNSYVSPFDWDNKMNIDNTNVSDSGTIKPWEVVLLPPKNTPSSAALPTRDGSKSYDQRSATLDMASTGGLLAGDLPNQNTMLPYPAYTPRKDTDVVSTSRFARVVNYYSNFETADADTDPANWGNKPALNTPDQVYANTGTLAQTVKAVSTDVKDNQGNAITTLPTVGNNFKDNLQVRYSGFMGDGAYIRPATLYVLQKRFMPTINLTNRVYNVTAAQLAKGITIDGNWTANWLPAMAVGGKVAAGVGSDSTVTVGDLTDNNPGKTGTWTKTTNPDNSAEAPGPHAFAFTVNDQADHTVPDSSGTLGVANSVGPHVITVRTTITYTYKGTQYTSNVDAQQIVNVVPDGYDQIKVNQSIVTDPDHYGMYTWQEYKNKIGAGTFVPNDYYNYVSPYDSIRGYVQPTDQVRMRARVVIPTTPPFGLLKNVKVSVDMPKTNDPAHPYFTLSPGATAFGETGRTTKSSMTVTKAGGMPALGSAPFTTGSTAGIDTSNPAITNFTHVIYGPGINGGLLNGQVLEIMYTLNVPNTSAANIPAQQVIRSTFSATTESGTPITLGSNAVYLYSGGDNTYGLLHVPDLDFGQLPSTAVGTAQALPADQQDNAYFEAFDNRAVEPIDPDSPTRDPWYLYAQMSGFRPVGGTGSISGSTITFNDLTTGSTPANGTVTAGGSPTKILTRPGGKYPAGYRRNVGNTTFTVGDNGGGFSGFTGGKYQATVTYTMTPDDGGSTLK
ncbi:hypothetical protein LH991_01665 [Schleiferilactobacillus harbinensis]|uniref:hypothetical protein n=1 Tax=Schleiferilactobacillus harbinensis TaxID=304207 RepID=UPI001265EF35|nr:hypothetical protein [Schleiferilactobacillus harbinensis]QFR62786.1 hypothetical protein LH991_01665 [Schleiferilactobacillus harbinensis]